MSLGEIIKVMKYLHTLPHKDGFTLIEVLITMIIFTFVIGMVYGVYQMGLFVYKDNETRLWTTQGARMSLERIIREARAAKSEPLPSILIDGFSFQNINSETIAFRISADKILRYKDGVGGNIIATGVSSFTVSLTQSSGSYKVTIRFIKDNYEVSGEFTPRNR
jgi:prepilin-type N-terminal cleavage/methylation domain-containing protein